MLTVSAERSRVRGEAQAFIHSPTVAFFPPQLHFLCAQENNANPKTQILTDALLFSPAVVSSYSGFLRMFPDVARKWKKIRY